MGRIHKLPDELANQIAAGEVVERPASVVKELVENALDAGATRIAIDVEHGGTELIRVSDDGEGMTTEDARLCLERHATSKIAVLTDLESLGTFGFRGEALPSIASVSRFSLRTRARGADEGCEIIVEGGATQDARPAGGAVGTTVSVRELFFNVPARRKFLKATATESAHVGDVVLGAALARPDVAFTFSRDGRQVREYLRATTRADRAKAALGSEPLVPCKAERWGIEIEAMLGPPERARAGATGLSLLVNGRPVRDRLLARAVSQAYGSVLEPGRYPVGVVWLDLPAASVDVNVHPQKAEVRFADARGLFDTIARELHAQLARAFGLPAFATYTSMAARAQAVTLRTLGDAAHAAMSRIDSGPSSMPPTQAAPLPLGNLFAEPSALPTSMGPSVYGSLRYVGQLRGMFLVCEGEDGMYVLDQHAAAERVTFDRLRRAHAARGIQVQRLLVSEVVELAASEVALLEEHAEEVASLGVEVRAVGETAVAVHGLPDLIAHAEPSRIVKDLVAELSRTAGRPFRGAVDLVLATMACHGSVRAGDAMSREQVDGLLVALDSVDFAGHCPHGRPLLMRMPWTDLERRVGR